MTSLLLRRKKNALNSKKSSSSQLNSDLANNLDSASASASTPTSDVNSDTTNPDPLCEDSVTANSHNQTDNIDSEDSKIGEKHQQKTEETSMAFASNNLKPNLDEDSEPSASSNTPKSEDFNNLNENNTSLKKQSPLDPNPPQSAINSSSTPPVLDAVASDSAILSKKNTKNKKKRIFSASRKTNSSKEKCSTKPNANDKKNSTSQSSSSAGTSFFGDSIGSFFSSNNNNATTSAKFKKSDEISTSKRSSSDSKGSKNSTKKSSQSIFPTSLPPSHSSRFSSVFNRDQRQASSSSSISSQNHTAPSTKKEKRPSRKVSSRNPLLKWHDSTFSNLKKKSETSPRASSSIGYSSMAKNHSSVSLNTPTSYSNRPSVDDIRSLSSTTSRRNSVNLLTPPSKLFPRSASSRSLNVDQRSVSSSCDSDNVNHNTNTSSRLFDGFFKYPFHKSSSPSASPKPKTANTGNNIDYTQNKTPDIPELTLSTTNNDLQPVLESDSSSSALSPKSTFNEKSPQEASIKSNNSESNGQVNEKVLRNSHSLFSFATNFISEHSASTSTSSNNNDLPPQQNIPTSNALSSDVPNSTSITASLKAPLFRIRKMTASMLFNTDNNDMNSPILNRSENSLPQTPSSEISFSLSNNNQESNSPVKSDSEVGTTSSDINKESSQNFLDTQGNPKISIPLSRTLSSQSPVRESSEANESPSPGFANLLASRPRSRTWSSLEQKPTSHFSLFSTKHSESSLTSLTHRQNNSNTDNNLRITNSTFNTPNSPQASLHTPTDPFSIQLPSVDSDETPATYLSKVRALGLGSNLAGILARIDDEFHRNVLRLYVMGFHFHNDPLDMALRKFLISVKLPRETQQIDRVLEAFAFRYHECNPGIYERPEDAYFFAFSLVLLHTDFFNPNNKMKMQKSDYLKINTEKEHQFIADEILSYFYDNITYTPFIHTDEDILEPGQQVRVHWIRKSSTFGRSSREPLDPYSVLLEGKLDSIRPQLSLNTQEDPYRFLPLREKEEVIQLRNEFERGPSLQLISQRSRPDAFRSIDSLDDPNLSGPGVVDIKIVKAGYLFRNEPKRKNSWKRWGIILTASKLYIFKDLSWFQNTIMAQIVTPFETSHTNKSNKSSNSKEHLKSKKSVASDSTDKSETSPTISSLNKNDTETTNGTNSPGVTNDTTNNMSSDSTTTIAIPQGNSDSQQQLPIFRPLVDGFHPTSVLVTNDMAALYCNNDEVKRPFSFLLAGRGGSREWFAGVSEEDANDWMKKINFAASFSTFFVAGMQGLTVSNIGTNLLMPPRKPMAMRSLRRSSESSAISNGNTSSNSLTNTTANIDTVTKTNSNTSINTPSISETERATIDELNQKHLERKFAVERRLEEIRRYLAQKEEQLNEQQRTARHVQILAPILAKTRESILQYAGSLSAKLNWNWMERKKLMCYENFFSLDLEVENDLCKDLDPEYYFPNSQYSSHGKVTSMSNSSSPVKGPKVGIRASTFQGPSKSGATLDSPIKIASKLQNSSLEKNINTETVTEVPEDDFNSSIDSHEFAGKDNDSKDDSAKFLPNNEDSLAGDKTLDKDKSGDSKMIKSTSKNSISTLKNENLDETLDKTIADGQSSSDRNEKISQSDQQSNSSKSLEQILTKSSPQEPILGSESSRTNNPGSMKSYNSFADDVSASENLRFNNPNTPQLDRAGSIQSSTYSSISNHESVRTAESVKNSSPNRFPKTKNNGNVPIGTSPIDSPASSIKSKAGSFKSGHAKSPSMSDTKSSKKKGHNRSFSFSLRGSNSSKNKDQESERSEKSIGTPSSSSPKRTMLLTLRDSPSSKSRLFKRHSISLASSPNSKQKISTEDSPQSSPDRNNNSTANGIPSSSKISKISDIDLASKKDSLKQKGTDSCNRSPIFNKTPSNKSQSLNLKAFDDARISSRNINTNSNNSLKTPKRAKSVSSSSSLSSSKVNFLNNSILLSSPTTPIASASSEPDNSSASPSSQSSRRSVSLVRKKGDNITLLGKQFHVVEVNPEFGGPFKEHRRAVSQNFSSASLPTPLFATTTSQDSLVKELTAGSQKSNNSNSEKSNDNVTPTTTSLEPSISIAKENS